MTDWSLLCAACGDVHAEFGPCYCGCTEPLPFTHDLLESLRIVEWEYSNHSSAPDAGKHAAALRTIAAIVASLLPPKP